MKRSTRMMVAALTILGLSAGGFAYAARGDGSCGGPQMMSGMAPAEFMGKRLNGLHAALKLSPEQEPAWQAWTGSMKDKMARMQAHRPDFAAMSGLPAPERMAQMLERRKEHQKEMEAGLVALRDFYGKLSPEQQKTFDSFRPFGEHRPGGKHFGPHGRQERG